MSVCKQAKTDFWDAHSGARLPISSAFEDLLSPDTSFSLSVDYSVCLTAMWDHTCVLQNAWFCLLHFFFLGSRKQQTKESEEFWMPASKPGGLPMSRGSYVLASIAAASLSPGKSARAATCTHSHSCTTVYGPSPLNQQSKCFPYTYNNFLFLPVNLDTE